MENIDLPKKANGNYIWLYFKVKQALHTDNTVVYRLRCCNPFS